MTRTLASTLALIMIFARDPRVRAEIEWDRLHGRGNGQARPNFDWWEPRYDTPDRRVDTLVREARQEIERGGVRHAR